jgi:hypothetical protein
MCIKPVRYEAAQKNAFVHSNAPLWGPPAEVAAVWAMRTHGQMPPTGRVPRYSDSFNFAVCVFFFLA